MSHQWDLRSQLEKLISQYFQLVDPRELFYNLPSPNTLKNVNVQTILYQEMFDENTIFPIPPASYRIRVLKEILSRIEKVLSDPEQDEILESLMGCYSELIARPRLSEVEAAQQRSYVKYSTPVSVDLTTLATIDSSVDGEHAHNILIPPSCQRKRQSIITSESRGLILSFGTTGFRTWEAALHLGTFLTATSAGRGLIHGKRVIELGAGTGFLSMVCAKYLDASKVVATDCEPILISNIDSSLSLNGWNGGSGESVGKVYPSIWEWGKPLHLTTPRKPSDSGGGGGNNVSRAGKDDVPPELQSAEFDIALGADLTYDTEIIPLLVSTIDDLFTKYNTQEFIISATIRNEDTIQAFLNACEEKKLQVQLVDFTSPPFREQTGFFHSTTIPIRTYSITPLRYQSE